MPAASTAYQVVGLLGRGGSGVVELAIGPSGERVATKRVALHGSARAIETAVRRMHREAELLAGIAHPGIVRLLAVEDRGDGVVLVMPFLAGGSLFDRVLARGPLPPEEVAWIADQLLPALGAAHAAGIVHRDVSPSNILFSAEEQPVLADFGIATCRQFTVGLTAANTVLGTPAYMAPEQARGDEAGPAADVFALGACLHFALTGESPVTGTSAWVEPQVALRWAAEARRSPLPPTVPAPLARLVEGLTDPDPSRRPRAEVATAVSAREAATVDLTIEAALPKRVRGRSTAEPSTPKRRRRWPFVAAAAVVAAGGASAVGLVGQRRAVAAVPTVTADPASFSVLHGPVSGCMKGPFHLGSCTKPPAAHTDGFRCTGPWLDVDAVAANGCEARPDDVRDGTALAAGSTRSANLLPAGDVDTITFAVTDSFQWFCDGAVSVDLTAADGPVKVAVTQGTDLLAAGTARPGSPVTVTVDDPRCVQDDAGTLTFTVSWAGPTPQRSPGAYTLKADGSF